MYNYKYTYIIYSCAQRLGFAPYGLSKIVVAQNLLDENTSNFQVIISLQGIQPVLWSFGVSPLFWIDPQQMPQPKTHERFRPISPQHLGKQNLFCDVKNKQPGFWMFHYSSLFIIIHHHSSSFSSSPSSSSGSSSFERE